MICFILVEIIRSYQRYLFANPITIYTMVRVKIKGTAGKSTMHDVQ